MIQAVPPKDRYLHLHTQYTAMLPRLGLEARQVVRMKLAEWKRQLEYYGVYV